MNLYSFFFFIYSVKSLHFFIRELHHYKRINKEKIKKIIINIECIIYETKNKDYINSTMNYNNIDNFN